ncbi:MAG TPA: helix-turn-helix domain-containing protein [Devosia sp.]
MGVRIERARKAAGYETAADLSRDLEVDGDTIRNWETGRNAPKYPKELRRLCMILDVDPGYILFGWTRSLSSSAKQRLGIRT